MNGRVYPPFHRVRVTEKKENKIFHRIVLDSKIRYIIESPKQLVDEKHPRVFKPFTYVDLIAFYLIEARRRAQSALRAYCAVSGA